MTDGYLEHHGILGMKWGVRRFQNADGSLTQAGKDRYSSQKTPPNTKLLKDYSGPAYFISDNESLSELNPRIPNNYFTEHGYEDNSTPRISFAPSVDKCLAGLSKNVEGKTFNVYKPVDISKHKVFKPNAKAVPDSSITDELWICEPVKLAKIGTIKVTGNKGQDGKKFTYGNKSAELYDDWTYEMDELEHADLYLEHHGILGMKWGVRRYQNADGSYTAEGKRHRDDSDSTPSKSDKIKRGAKIAAGILGAAALVYIAHKTGTDKKAIEAGKKLVSPYVNKKNPKFKKVEQNQAVKKAERNRVIREVEQNQAVKKAERNRVIREAEQRRAAREAHLKEINAAMNVQMKNINRAGKAGQNLNDMAERFIKMNDNLIIR